MNTSTNSVHQEELLWLFEDNFTDIINTLELWDLELRLMKQFSEFKQGLVQSDFTYLG